MGKTTMDSRISVHARVSKDVNTQCLIVSPNKLTMIAGCLERRNKKWVVQTEVACDLAVKVGTSNFCLHKLPILSRSGYINRAVFRRRASGDSDSTSCIQLDNFPGGSKTFELVVRFCYGWKVNLTASNIAPLYCAANFLEMSDDYVEANLISITETFLGFILFSSWKGIFEVLKSCESISPWAQKLKILERCSEAIAWKVCTNPRAIASDDMQGLHILAGNTRQPELEGLNRNWWFEDISLLRIDHFVQVVDAIKRRGMEPDLIGACIAEWTEKWLSRVTLLDDLTPQKLTYQLQRVTIETLTRILPLEENSVSCNFLLQLLQVGILMESDPGLINQLVYRVALMLEKCQVQDLLVRSRGSEETTYDVVIVIRVVKCYVSFVCSPGLFAVGKLVDSYLALIAREEKLGVENFSSLAESLPKNARTCHDNLYRAIDMYLKAHPNLTEQERMSICKALDYQKLSKEADQHATKNDRLPLSMITRFILLDQVSMTRSMTSSRSNFQRTKTQAIIRTNKCEGQGLLSSQKEINMMRKEVDMMKLQLDRLLVCKMELQLQMRKGIR